MVWVWVVLLVIGIFLIRLLISRGVNKGVNAIERGIRSEAYSDQKELLETVVIFAAKAAPAVCRAALKRNVAERRNPAENKPYAFTLRGESATDMLYDFGVPGSAGFRAVVRLQDDGAGGTSASYRITQHTYGGGVSEYRKQLAELRNEVTAAFKEADPNVQISKASREMKEKMSWL